MQLNLRNPYCVLGLVLLWRVLLLVFTAQPIPANDCYFFDGPVRHSLLHGQFVNPSLIEVFPISGGQVFSAYPPVYLGVLFLWLKLFGLDLMAVMALHLTLFAASGLVTLRLAQKLFPAATPYALAAWLFFGFTFGDRPESLAHLLGLLALLLIAKNSADEPRWPTALAAGGLLLLTLYTSVIVGAFYFGVGGVTAGLVWLARRKLVVLVPFVLAAALFAVITLTIIQMQPLLWQGFQENARQTPLLTGGFHPPNAGILLKFIRTAPVFLLAWWFVPLVILRWRELFTAPESGWFLPAGIFVFGWILLPLTMTILSSNYIAYVMFTQIILAAGLLVLNEKYSLLPQRWLQGALVGCVLLVSIRAIGMTTWGVACAVQNSYGRTQATLQAELAPFTRTNTPVVISTPFLYRAQTLGVQRPIYGDWYFDRANPAPNTDLAALCKLRPTKLVLTQFEYYRGFVPVLEKLRRQPGSVTVRVRDLAGLKPPDATPALQRVVQHISWAPVIVDLNWSPPAP